MAYEASGPGIYGPYYVPGAPTTGTNEVQTATFGGTPTGGTFRLILDGTTTGPITHTGAAMTGAAMATAMNTALDAAFGSAQIVAAAGTFATGVGTMTLTFSGSNYSRQAVNTMTVTNNLTGTSPTLAVAETTPGVAATGRAAPKGALVMDTTTGIVYVNTGVIGTPTWTKVGLQT